MINTLALAKNATTLIVGFGTGKIVGSIIKNNVAVDTAIDKIVVVSASYVIGSMAADATSKYTDAKIEELAAWWTENVKNRKTSAKAV